MVKLENGRHILSGIKTDIDVRLYNCDHSSATIILMDDKRYIIYDDPADGYRSMGCFYEVNDELASIMTYDSDLQQLKRLQNELLYPIPNEEVDIQYIDKENGWYGYDKDEYYEFRNVKNGEIILRIGTKHYNDYYPCTLFEYHPENLNCNMRPKYSEAIENVVNLLENSDITVLSENMANDEIYEKIFTAERGRMFVYLGNGTSENTWKLCQFTEEFNKRKINVIFESMKEDYGDTERMIKYFQYGKTLDDWHMRKKHDMMAYDMKPWKYNDCWLNVVGISDDNRFTDNILERIAYADADINAHVDVDFKYVMIDNLNVAVDSMHTIDRYQRIINVCNELKAGINDYNVIVTVDIRDLAKSDDQRYEYGTLQYLTNGIHIVKRDTKSNPVFMTVADMHNVFNNPVIGYDAYIFMDKPKGGKTWEMSCIAMDALKNGHTVAYVNFEDDINQLKRRMTAYYCGMTMDQYIRQSKPNDNISIDIEAHTGMLHIFNFQSDFVTINEVVEKILTSEKNNNIKYDVVIFDGLNGFSINGDNIHERSKNLSMQIRSILEKYKWSICCSANAHISEWI